MLVQNDARSTNRGRLPDIELPANSFPENQDLSVIAPLATEQTEAPINATACPVCDSWGCRDVFSANNIPVLIGICGKTYEEARALPRGDVILSWCGNCGFLHNRLFDPNRVSYQPGYEVALHHSPTFVNFMEGVTTRLLKRFELQNKRILEIGCGDAYLLRMLADLGSNDCTGFDPTIASEGVELVGNGKIELIRDYFGPHCSVDADFICCLSVFENIAQPVQFLRNLRQQIGSQTPGIYFEIFNALQAIQRMETWSISYEQTNYFSRSSLSAAFEQAGFQVLEASECYEGDQYIFVDAVPAQESRIAVESESVVLPQELLEFARRHKEQTQFWSERMNDYRDFGRRVVVWGAGGKGLSFLNQLDSEGAVSYVVDINPDKQGQFIPGSAQQIVSPESLAEYQPETVILMNPLYEAEIRQQLTDLGISCELLTA